MVTPTHDDTIGHGPADGDPDGTDRTIPLPPNPPPGGRVPQARRDNDVRPGADRADHADPPGPVTGVRDARWKRILSYPVLYVLAGADAFGFWNTLTQIIKRDSNLVLVFVMALAIAAVAVPHQAGRLVRSRREGYGGSVAWLGVLSTLWLALGTTMAWLRWTTPTKTTGRVTGRLAPAAATDDSAVHIAILLLVLFLLTGALAMTHGYRFGDPRTPEIKAAERERMRIIRELPDYRREVTDAEGQLAAIQRRKDQVEESRSRSHEIDAALVDQLRSQARNDIAGHVGDPSGTDELHLDFPETRLRPRGAPAPYRAPPDI